MQEPECSKSEAQSEVEEEQPMARIIWGRPLSPCARINGLPTFTHAELVEKLRDLTPPPDEEADIAEGYVIENRARKELERCGCPPCYPPEVPLPLDDVPVQYRSIVEYWKIQYGIRYEALHAQLRDWKQFQQFQDRARAFYGKEDFERYNQRIRERAELRGDQGVELVDVDWDASTQNLRQKLVEFAHFHHKNHELKLERLTLAEAVLRDHEATGVVNDNTIAFTNDRDWRQRQVKEHNCLLKWIHEIQLSQQTDPAFASKILVAAKSRRKGQQSNSTADPTDRISSRLRKRTKTKEATRNTKTEEGRQRAQKTETTLRKKTKKLTRDVGSELTKTRSGRVSRPPTRYIAG